MLKVLILVLMIAPPVWTQPLPEMTELEGILTELEQGLTELNEGTRLLTEGMMRLETGQIASEMALSESSRELTKLEKRQKDLELIFSDYKESIQVAAEAQKVAIRGLKTSRTISFVITGAAVVGLVLVVIFK